jgi:hypothetical protein
MPCRNRSSSWMIFIHSRLPSPGDTQGNSSPNSTCPGRALVLPAPVHRQEVLGNLPGNRCESTSTRSATPFCRRRRRTPCVRRRPPRRECVSSR